MILLRVRVISQRLLNKWKVNWASIGTVVSFDFPFVKEALQVIILNRNLILIIFNSRSAKTAARRNEIFAFEVDKKKREKKKNVFVLWLNIFKTYFQFFLKYTAGRDQQRRQSYLSYSYIYSSTVQLELLAAAYNIKQAKAWPDSK